MCVSSAAGSLVWERALTTTVGRGSQIVLLSIDVSRGPTPGAGKCPTVPHRDRPENSAAVSLLVFCVSLGRRFLFTLPPPLRGVDWLERVIFSKHTSTAPAS